MRVFHQYLALSFARHARTSQTWQTSAAQPWRCAATAFSRSGLDFLMYSIFARHRHHTLVLISACSPRAACGPTVCVLERVPVQNLLEHSTSTTPPACLVSCCRVLEWVRGTSIARPAFQHHGFRFIIRAGQHGTLKTPGTENCRSVPDHPTTPNHAHTTWSGVRDVR